MAIVVFPRKRKTKPWVGVRLNSNSPLSQGLKGLWLVNDGSNNTREYLTNFFAGSTSQTWVAGDNGLALNNTAQSSLLDTGSPWSNLSYASGTIVMRVYPTFVPTDSVRYFFWGAQATGGTVPELSFQKFTDNNIYAGWNTSGNDARVIVAASTTNILQNQWQIYVFIWSSAGSTLYLNGNSVGSTVTAPTPTSSAADFYWMNCANIPTLGLPSGSRMDFGAIYNRALTAPEIQLISQDPYSMLALPKRIVGFPAAAAITQQLLMLLGVGS